MLPNLIYGLSVYGAYERDVNTVQNFLKRCYKRRYISVPLNVKDIMHMHNKKLFSGARALSHHPLNEILPKPKPQQYNLRRKVCSCPKINTECFMNTFVNRLIFEHNLLWLHNLILAIVYYCKYRYTVSRLCNIGYISFVLWFI